MRNPLVSLSLAVALLLPAACGGSGGDGSGSGDGSREVAGGRDGRGSEIQRLVTETAANVAAARTYGFEGRVSYPLGERSFDVVLKGAVDTGSVGRAVGERATEPFTRMELDLTGTPLARGGTFTSTMILDGTAFYLRFPEGDQAGVGMAPGGKTWGEFDTTTLGEGTGAGFKPLLDEAKKADPARSIALLTGAADDIREVGPEKVRDIDTRHLTFTVNVEEVSDNAAEEWQEAAKSLFATLGSAPVSVDVWIGLDGLPRRIAYSVDPALKRDLIRATVELFDYGAPVERTLPAPEETFDFTVFADSGR